MKDLRDLKETQGEVFSISLLISDERGASSWQSTQWVSRGLLEQSTREYVLYPTVGDIVGI